MNNTMMQQGGGQGGVNPADMISKYLTMYASGGGNPMRSVGNQGVRESNYGFNGSAQANIPINKLIEDAMLRLNIGGFAHGGKVKLPQQFQDMGAPAEIQYGDKGIDNVGVGFSKGGFSAGMQFNPQTNSKSINARYQINF